MTWTVQLEEDSQKHLMYCLKFNGESYLVAVMSKYKIIRVEWKNIGVKNNPQKILEEKTNFEEGKKKNAQGPKWSRCLWSVVDSIIIC